MNNLYSFLCKSYKRLAKKKRLIGFLIIVVLFIPIIIYGLNYTTPPTNDGIIGENTILITENTVYSLEPLHYTYAHFSIPKGVWNLEGLITSSTSVMVYVLNQSSFTHLTQDKSVTPIYEAYANSCASLNVTLGPGSYFLVFFNVNEKWGVGVEITSSITITKN